MFNSKKYNIGKLVSKAINEKLNESRGIRSKKIYDAIKSHGGIDKDDIYYPVYDLHNLTDDEFVCVMPNKKVSEIRSGHNVDMGKYIDNFGLLSWAKQNGVDVIPGDNVEAIRLGDKKNSLIVIVRNEKLYKNREDGWRNYWNKRQEREKNLWSDGKKHYFWTNKEAEDIFKNPYFKNWPRAAQEKKMDKARDFSNRMVKEEIEKKLKKERLAVDTNPSEAEIKANNYSHGHIWINGFEISIENPKGSYRKGKDRNGKEWETLMKNDYGYFTRTVGKDGDAIDVFIGPNLKSVKIFCVDQKIGGKFDETKVMFCFNSIDQAKNAYMSNYGKDWKGFWRITEVEIDKFKKWLYDGHRQRKPFHQYVEFDGCVVMKEGRQQKEYDEISDYVDEVIGLLDIEKTSRLDVMDVSKNKYGTTVLKLSGGINGNGNWHDYFNDLLKLYDAISKKCTIWLIKIDVDTIDDVFYADFGIEWKKSGWLEDDGKRDKERLREEFERIVYNFHK